MFDVRYLPFELVSESLCGLARNFTIMEVLISMRRLMARGE